MTFNEYVETFAGMPIREHKPGEAITDSNVAWRVAIAGDADQPNCWNIMSIFLIQMAWIM